MSRTERVWRVRGRITGPALPAHPVTIGRVDIAPLAEGEEIPKQTKITDITPKDNALHIWSVPKAHIAINSNIYFGVSIEATSHEAAAARAEENEIATLQVVLSLLGSERPYQVEVIGSKPLKVSSLYQPRELREDELKRCQMLYRGMADDVIATKTTKQFQQAISQEAVATDTYSEQAALLAYFKVIETLAHVGSKSLVSGPEDETDRSRVVSELLHKLASRREIRKKCIAVEEAYKKIGRLDAKFLTIKIVRAGENFGLPIAWRAQAKEFAEFRNRKLSHGGQTPSRDQLSAWLNGCDERDSAFVIARKFFQAYLDTVVLGA